LLVRFVLSACIPLACFAAGPLVDFNRDVRPILSDNCFTCHGPDDKHRVVAAHLADTVAAPAVERFIAAARYVIAEILAELNV